MLHRLAVVIYLLLNIPLVIIPIYTVYSTQFWEDINVSTYQARCKSNSELVVLQGTTNTYTFTSNGLKRWDVGEELRFHCNYYNEIQQLNKQYLSAKNENDRINANLEFNKFWGEHTKPLINNYNLELLSTKSNYQSLWFGISRSIIITGIYFLLLQAVRIIYQYVVFSSFSWHPYKRYPVKNGKI